MVNLTRIYTRTGDDGTTHLGDMSRTSKTDVRLLAYADSNEANAAIGVAIAAGDLREDLRTTLTRVQNDLFDVGADLCTPLQETYEYPPLRVKEEWVAELEADCDRYLEELEKLRSFILPGGTPGSAYLHVATTVVRRAERQTWAAIEAYGDQPGTERGHGGVNVLTARYLNRLSDLLFVLARVANLPLGGDVLWQPGGGRAAAPDRARTAPGTKATDSTAADTTATDSTSVDTTAADTEKAPADGAAGA
jgi:cob(I)alamin adenosyltransferase